MELAACNKAPSVDGNNKKHKTEGQAQKERTGEESERGRESEETRSNRILFNLPFCFALVLLFAGFSIDFSFVLPLCAPQSF